MKALLWKEFREKRVWGLVWAASIVLVYSSSFNFCNGDLGTIWLLFPILLSLIVGATAYSTELKGNRVDFLYSQPISWTKLLLAKALFGLAVVLGSTVLSAIIFRISCPDYYVAFATPARLAYIVKSTVWWFWTIYMSGLFFSVAVPGFTGGLVVLVANILLMGAMQSIGPNYIPESYKDMFTLGQGQAILLGQTIAALLLLRFGLTLPLKSRAIRYGVVVLATCAIVPTLFLAFPKDTFVNTFCRKDCTWSRVSPRGDYALAVYTWSFMEKIGLHGTGSTFREASYIVRLSDGKATPVDLDLPNCPICVWVNGNTAYCCSEGSPGIRVVRLTPGGKVVMSRVKLDSIPTQILPSADSSAAIVASQGPKGTSVVVLDTDFGKPVTPPIGQASAYWWQSGNQVGYLDCRGARHILSLHP